MSYVRENNRWKKTSLQSMNKRSHTHLDNKKRLNGSTAVTGDSVLQVTLKNLKLLLSSTNTTNIL